MLFQVEGLNDIYEKELIPLMKRHWEDMDSHLGEFDPNEEFYKALNDLGLIRLYTIRIKDKIVSYALFVFQRAIHQKKIVTAISDAIWCCRDSVKSHPTIPLALIRNFEADIKNIGATRIRISGKIDHPDLLRLLVKMGYIHEGFAVYKDLTEMTNARH